MRVPFPRLPSEASAGPLAACPFGATRHLAAWCRDFRCSPGGNGARPQAYDLPVSSA